MPLLKCVKYQIPSKNVGKLCVLAQRRYRVNRDEMHNIAFEF